MFPQNPLNDLKFIEDVAAIDGMSYLFRYEEKDGSKVYKLLLEYNQKTSVWIYFQCPENLENELIRTWQVVDQAREDGIKRFLLVVLHTMTGEVKEMKYATYGDVYQYHPNNLKSNQ